MINLRPYQRDFIRDIHHAFAGGAHAVLGQSPTGSGKTVIFSYITEGAIKQSNVTGILVHRQELILQTALALGKFQIPHKIIAPDSVIKTAAQIQYREFGRNYIDFNSPCLVASVQTLGRKLDEYKNFFKFIITDECFIGETLVNTKFGYKKIKNINKGDLVYTFNEISKKIELKKVIKVIKKPIYKDLCEVSINGKKIICTQDHLFFTKKGWTQAKNLAKNSMVLNITQRKKENEMYNLWNGNRKSDKVSKIQIQKRWQSLLLRRMWQRICPQNFIGNNGENKSQICFGTYDEKQSYEKRYNKRKSFSEIKSNRTQAKNKRGKRTNYNSAITTCHRFGLGNGISGKNTKKRKLSIGLQNRYCKSDFKNWHRSGWKQSLRFIQTSRRQEENGFIKFARVEYSKVQKQGSSKQFERLYRQGYVYDLTVENNHNYFVNDILVHNCHHAVAGQWRNITDANPHAYLLGLSATPERLDGKGLGVECGGVYETLVLGPSVRSLIEQGYLSQPRVFAPPIDFNSDSLKTIAGDYDVKQMAEMLDRPQIIGDAVKHYAKICPNMPAIAFCATIEHAQHTAEQFCQAGFKFKSIDGTMSDYERRDAIEGLGSGRYDGLTSCNIISEGTDIPVVGCAIFLRKTKSLGLYLQQAGRVLRPYSGKKYSIILDHVRNVEMHGFPDDDREWSLEGRKKRNRQDGEQLFVRTCLNCYACYPSKLTACPVCGCENSTKTRQEIEYIDAELLEMKRLERIDERKHAFAFSQLLEIGKRRGYKNPYAWAKIVINSRRKGKK